MAKRMKTVPSFKSLTEPHTEWEELRDKANEERREESRLTPKTANQANYFDAVENRTVTLCAGPAGTGKTLIACWFAAEALKKGEIKKIILTRPLVACGKGIGFLPGEKDEKVAPYMRPLLDALEKFIHPKELEKLLKSGVIEMLPLELTRGTSIEDAFMICDEAQNAEYSQLHMFLTRFGKGTKVVMTGDPTKTQTDLQGFGPNPFQDVIRRLGGIGDIAVVFLDRSDVQRHGLTGIIDERLSD